MKEPLSKYLKCENRIGYINNLMMETLGWELDSKQPQFVNKNSEVCTKLPNWAGSHEAMTALERELTDAEAAEYVRWVEHFLGPWNPTRSRFWQMLTAEPIIRAKAYIMMKGVVQ